MTPTPRPSSPRSALPARPPTRLTRPGSCAPVWPTAAVSPWSRPTPLASSSGITRSSSTSMPTTGPRSSPPTPRSAPSRGTAAPDIRCSPSTSRPSTSAITPSPPMSPATAAPTLGTPPRSGPRTPPGLPPPPGTEKEFSMSKQPWMHRFRRTLLAAGTTAVLVAGLITATSATSQGATQQPCDIYASGGTPCVAAHSTTRALYSAYNRPLHQVRRASDNATKDIGLLSAGGYANAAAQDSFCANTSCVITVIYDQSGRGNHLTQALGGYWPGPGPGGVDNLANATDAPVTVAGHKAYGVYVAPGTGYRNNQTSGIAIGDQPEGEHAVLDGTHYDG